MNIVSAENLSKNYGVRDLFSGITLGLQEGEKVGLIGVNGTGKSTLLKILAGIEAPDEGKVTVSNAVRIEYLPQQPSFDDQEKVLQQVLRGNTLTTEELWQVESEAKTILTKLGIFDFNALVGTLSGGQRKRVALARALIRPSELLIMDEPTNHLDNETIAWLEQFLKRRKGALIMITHDRYFLDRVVNTILELDKGKLYSYEGNFSRYLEQKLAREEQEQASEEKRLNVLRNELKWIKRGAKARTTKQKARIERFEKLQADKPANAAGDIDISVGASRLGKKVIILEKVSKGFKGNTCVAEFSYTFLRDDRIGIVGPNGVGKSTLLNLLAGRVKPDTGIIEVGDTVKIGYFSQESREMNEGLRVIEYVKEVAEFISTADGKMISAAQMLERFLFSPAMQWTPIANISGGERRRLFLLRVLMSAPNVLLLDEPTNDLDIQTLAILEDYLDEFPGVVVVVSHDRYFLDRVVDKTFAFTGDGHIKSYVGNYADYLESSKGQVTAQEKGTTLREQLWERPMEQPMEQPMGRNSNVQPAGKNSRPLKFSYKEQREFEEIDDIISDVEQQLKEVKCKINEAGSDFVLLQELLNQQQSLEEHLEQLMERWAYLNELAEQIELNRGSAK